MNSKKISLLPYRPCVGITLINHDNKIFAGQRIDNSTNAWQMPQGGVNSSEDFNTAMRRELYEETSIKDIKIIKEINHTYEYELPKNLIGIIWKGKFRGQKQKWFIAKFLGNENEINLNTNHPEFIEWKWIDARMLPSVIVNFKKSLYLNLLKEIKLVIG